MTARSVIASTLLGVDPPRLPAPALVGSGQLFGLSEGAIRTALSRMAATGEVVADDGDYVLAGDLLERHHRQQSARDAPPATGWDGTWQLAVVTAERRRASDRSALRDAARRLLLAEVREGTWARPDNLAADRAPAARAVVDQQCAWVWGARVEDPGAFVAAFEPEAWAAGARELIDEMRRGQPGLDARDLDAVSTTFVTAAAVLRHLVADPRLPAELVPADWPGAELRAVFDRFDEAFTATWTTWYRTWRSR